MPSYFNFSVGLGVACIIVALIVGLVVKDNMYWVIPLGFGSLFLVMGGAQTYYEYRKEQLNTVFGISSQ